VILPVDSPEPFQIFDAHSARLFDAQADIFDDLAQCGDFRFDGGGELLGCAATASPPASKNSFFTAGSVK
jgi:hypothetical protein